MRLQKEIVDNLMETGKVIYDFKEYGNTPMRHILIEKERKYYEIDQPLRTNAFLLRGRIISC